MNIVAPGIYTSLQLFVIIGIGFFVKKMNIVKDGFQQAVSGFIVKVALPVYFFAKFSSTDLGIFRKGLWLPVAGLFIIGTGLLIGWILYTVLPFSGPEKRAGIALAGFGNSGYMPLTILELLPISIPFMAVEYNSSMSSLFVGAYLIVFSPLLWSVGNFLVAKHGTGFSPSHLLSAPTVGILLGLIFPVFGIDFIITDPELPFYYVHAALERLGTVIFPMILINLGVMIGSIQFHHTKASRLGLMAAGVIVVRFLCIPALFFAGYFLFLKNMNVHPAILLTLFLETHTPPATNLSAMAVEGGVNEDLTAFTLLVTYVGYIIILPVYLILFLNL